MLDVGAPITEGILALTGRQAARQVHRETRRRRRQPACRQPRDAFGGNRRRAVARRTAPRPEEGDRSEHRHRTAGRDPGLPAVPSVEFQGRSMIVKQLEGVAQDRAGHVEDHVAERAFGFRRVASVQGRDIPRQTDFGSALDQGDARFR